MSSAKRSTLLNHIDFICCRLCAAPSGVYSAGGYDVTDWEHQEKHI